MTPDIIIKGKALYTTKGAAREYGRIGCNFYTGCPHECTYCYLKRGAPSKQLGGNKVRLKACFKDVGDAADTLRRELDKHLEQCQRYGIFLSFTTDPLIDETRGLTMMAMTEAVWRDIPVRVLTKNSTYIYDEVMMAYLEHIQYRNLIHFGFTLTGHDEMEPRANTNQDRIMAMQRMHLMGFSTFASIEPVITWEAAERMVCESLSCCDHYKLGLRSGVKKDYYDITESGAAIERIVRTVEAHGKTIYLKESTRKLLMQYFQPGAYEAFLSHTVDMDGKRIQHDYAITNSNCQWADSKKIKPTTKEQRDLLFQKMGEAHYEWDAKEKKLKKIHIIDEGKAEMDYCFTKMMNGEKVSPAWSEEDELSLKQAIYVCHQNGYTAVENWLKSIKQRIGG